MENKQPKRRWKIPVLLVSAICILLASSFVFSIGVEALTYDYSLQTFYLQNPVDRDGSDYATVDTSVIVDMSVTENNDFSSGFVNGSVYHYSPFSGLGYTAFGFENFLYCYGSSGTYYVVTADQTYQYSTNGIYYPFGYSYSGNLYDLEGNLLYTVGSYGIQCCAYYNSFYYVFYITGSSSSRWFNVAIVNENFVLVETLQERGDWNSKFQMLLLDGAFAFFKDSNIVFFDFDDRVFSSVDLSAISYPPEGEFVASYDGDSVYMFSTNASYQSVKYTLSSGALSNLPAVTAFVATSDVYFCSYYSGSFICNTRTQIVTLNYQDYFYDFGSYVDFNSYTPDRYLNFESHYTSSLLSGGYHVGIELDFGVSPLMFSQVGLKGFEIGVTTLIASDYMISSESTITAPRPLNCWNGTNYITDYRTSYSYIGQRDGKYLYMCTSSCNFATQGRLNPIKVVINCYLPYQVASHNFSIPVSIFSLTDEYSGGGESSDNSSGGTSSGGAGNETGAPSEMPPESVFYEDTLYIYKKLPDGGFGWVTDWNIKDYKSISVFTGYAPSVALSGYINSQLEQYIGTIRIIYQDGRKAYIETDGTGIVGYGSSENSMVYPFSLGGWVDVEISENNYLYIDQNMPENILVVGSGDTNYLQLNMRSDADLVFVRANDEDTDIGWVSGNGETGELTVRQKIWQLQKYGNVSGYYDTHYFSAGQFFSFHRYDFPPATTGGVFNGFCFLNLYFYTGDKSPLEVSIEYSIYLEEQSRIAAEESYLNYLAGLAYGDMNFDADYSDGFGDAFDIQDGLYDVPAGAMITGTWDSLWDSHPFAFAMISTVIVFAIVKFIINKV